MYLAQIRQTATTLTGAGGSNLINTAKAQYASKTRDVSLGEIFNKIDTDGDGVVSKEEFDRAKSETEVKKTEALTSLKTGSTASLVSLLESAGQSSAANGTGGTGSSGAATTQNKSLSSDQIFSKIDTNGDGVIGRDEFENLNSSLKSSTAGSTTGASGSSGTTTLSSAQQNAATSVASQTRALLQQAISQYKLLQGAGQTAGAAGQYL